jgi:hypothetical protein
MNANAVSPGLPALSKRRGKQKKRQENLRHKNDSARFAAVYFSLPNTLQDVIVM